MLSKSLKPPPSRSRRLLEQITRCPVTNTSHGSPGEETTPLLSHVWTLVPLLDTRAPLQTLVPLLRYTCPSSDTTFTFTQTSVAIPQMSCHEHFSQPTKTLVLLSRMSSTASLLHTDTRASSTTTFLWTLVPFCGHSCLSSDTRAYPAITCLSSPSLGVY